MNTRQKVAIDRYFFGFFARLMNLLVIPLGKLLRINHDLNRPFKRIVICKYKGLGSIIQSGPLLQSLRQAYPDAEIIYLTSIQNKVLINHLEGVDRGIYLDDRNVFTLLRSVMPMLWKLIRFKSELFLDLEVYSNFSTLISVLSLSKNRMGFYLNSKHYRLGNYTHMMYYNTRSPISQTYLQYARLLGIPIHSDLLAPKMESKVVHDKPYILINPNASDLRIERRWPKDRFVSLIRQLHAQYPEYDLVLIGAPDESKYVANILKSCTEVPVINLAGKTTLMEVMQWIQQADLMVSNDSGPLHMAFAFNVKVVALFGPVAPIQYAMNSQRVIALYKHLYCAPCVHEFALPPCKGKNICMESIGVDEVMTAVMQLLKDEVTERAGVRIQYQFNDHIAGRVERN